MKRKLTCAPRTPAPLPDSVRPVKTDRITSVNVQRAGQDRTVMRSLRGRPVMIPVAIVS